MGHHKILYERIIGRVVVDIDLLVLIELTDLSVVLLRSPTIWAEAIWRNTLGLRNGFSEKGNQVFCQLI